MCSDINVNGGLQHGCGGGRDFSQSAEPNVKWKQQLGRRRCLCSMNRKHILDESILPRGPALKREEKERGKWEEGRELRKMRGKCEGESA